MTGPTLYAIPAPVPGRLSTMARPRGDGLLDEHMRQLRAACVDVLVCLLAAVERDTLGLAGEPEAATRAGIEFCELPIADFGVPSHAEAQPLLDLLVRRVRGGSHVAVHCRGGIGRSSMVAAAVLVRLGASPADAWATVAEARGCPVPETAEQRAWLG